MKEAIKGQNKLKLAVEKLEVDIFKDWPAKSCCIESKNYIIVGGSSNIKITGCSVSNTQHNAKSPG